MVVKAGETGGAGRTSDQVAFLCFFACFEDDDGDAGDA